MRVSVVQMVSGTQLQSNLQRASDLIAQAAKEGAELALLPKHFGLIGQRDTDKLAIQEQLGSGPIQQCLAEAARENGLWVVGGTLPLSAPGQSDDRVFNCSLVFSPQGQCVARYDKIHLFCFDNGLEQFDESRTLLAGKNPAMFELPSRDGHRWRIGLSVCYDLRFPELYRSYAQRGADLLLVPSAFTYTTGQAHWEVLLRARAIENLSYVMAAAQGGVHETGRRTWGHSLVCDPWGGLLGQLTQGEGLVTADLSLPRLQTLRQQLPALSHRVL